MGGDIPALQNAGHTMKPAPQMVSPVTSELSSTIDRIVGSASWSGKAASAMRARWTRNAVEVASVGTFIGNVGETLGQLGNGLSDVESALYNSADACRRRGAQISDTDGKPLSLVITGDPSSPEAQDAMKAQQEYQAAYEYAMQAAHALRMAAARELQALVKPVISGSNEKTPADKATMASILRGVYTGKYESTGRQVDGLTKDREKASENFNLASERLEASLEEYTRTGGPKLPVEALQRAGVFDDAFAKFQAVDREVKTKLPELETRWQLPGSALLNTKLGDIADAIPKGNLSEKLGAFKAIPVLDIAANSVMVYGQAKDDIERGQDPATAITKDAFAAGAGLAAGTAVAGPGAMVAAGIVTAFGMGDGIYQGFHEHWSEDIQNSGYVAGIAGGILNTGAREWGDVKNMVSEAGNMASSVWHNIFG